MADLLLELFSEEIPARMQAAAARDLERLVVGGLTDRGFLNEGARSFATPRRLALVIEGLPSEQADVKEERKGPKVDAPDAAIQGFLRSTGLSKSDFAKMPVTRRSSSTTGNAESCDCAAMRSMTKWPKPLRSGGFTGGPPVSFHVNASRGVPPSGS